ncbi:TetR/AcrR family transcriptional regulator [Paenibacillus filicis]|uniref:TetR/AcrR family transcriptional regulator n=1 Tax=Paenibacillus filicis TaxID=669464 RepID=A0ABU9DMU3_9BACL
MDDQTSEGGNIITEPLNNRDLIIAKTHDLLIEHGIKATSIKLVAQAAGVAPGLIHYYFKSKEELILAVLEEAKRQCLQDWDEILRRAKDIQQTEHVLKLGKERLFADLDMYRLRFELYSNGLNNSTVKSHVNALLQEEQRKIAELSTLLARKEGVNHEAIAATLTAAFDGLALRKLTDESFDLNAAYETLSEMYLSFT